MLFNACCCDPSCLIFQDNFDRTNSNDIGSQWVDTNARILDNRLTQQVLAAMQVITTQAHTSEMMVVDVAMSFTPSSITVDVGGVIVNYLDANNYLYVQLEVISSAFAGTVSTKLKFFRRFGGVTSQLGSTRTIDATNAIHNHQLRVCYDGTYLSAMGYREAATKITDGFKAGLYSSAASNIYFNNFRWYKWQTGCPNCTPTPQCGYCFDNSEPTGTVIIDFGAATLTDSGWNACDQILGEYILTLDDSFSGIICGQSTLARCFWVYQNLSGTYTDIWCSGKIVSLCMAASIQADVSGQSQWSVTIQASVAALAGCRFGPAVMSASYRGNHTVHGVCNQSPVTLSKVFQFFNAQPACTGTLPATIELRLG